MEKPSINLSITAENNFSFYQNLAFILVAMGSSIFALALFNVDFPQRNLALIVALSSLFLGTIAYTYHLYANKPIGIKNDGVFTKSLTNKGIWGYLLGLFLTIFYVVLYWFPQYLGYNSASNNTGLVGFFDPLSILLNGKPASQWFVYGTLYTLAILSLGIKFIVKYWHNKYQLLRTCSVMFFQLAFAFLIPEFLQKLNPEKAYFAKDIKNMWPLNYYFFNDWHLKAMITGGNLGQFMLIWGIALIFIVSPILTYFFGKRWYCSWVCGCGGLAETAGDPFRQLSNKSTKAWKLERWLIHSILVLSLVMTIAVIFTFLNENPQLSIVTSNQFLVGVIVFILASISFLYVFKRNELDKDARFTMISLSLVIVFSIITNFVLKSKNIFFIDSNALREWYGFLIGSAFSGVIGVGFYPIFGNRVWCRFGCPMAAILGLQQRLFSKFQITTNGDQCISCGNCSTFCEMGIDVRSYAQKGENIIRSSCVGCGICSAVCPRGVLKLENVR